MFIFFDGNEQYHIIVVCHSSLSLVIILVDSFFIVGTHQVKFILHQIDWSLLDIFKFMIECTTYTLLWKLRLSDVLA